MGSAYSCEEMAAYARQTAKEAGCTAVHWRPDILNPQRLWIDASCKESDGRTRTVLLVAYLPERSPTTPSLSYDRGHSRSRQG